MADTTTTPVWRRLEGTLAGTAKSLRQTYDAVLTSLGLTLPEATLIAYVCENGPVTQTEIAAGLDAGRPLIGQRIDAMEARGYVERLAHSTDRRVWMVSATSAGQAINGRVLEIDRWFRDAVRKGISAEERHVFVSVLLRIRDNLDVMATETNAANS